MRCPTQEGQQIQDQPETMPGANAIAYFVNRQFEKLVSLNGAYRSFPQLGSQP